MIDNTKRLFVYLLYFSLIAGAIVLCFNSGPKALAFVLYAALGCILIYHARQHHQSSGEWAYSSLFVMFEFVLAIAVQFFDHSVLSGFDVLIVIATALLSCRPTFSIPFAVSAVLVSFAMAYFRNPSHFSQNFWENTVATLLPRVFFISAVCIARYNIMLNQKNHQLNNELQQKTQELEDAVCKLKAYADELRETADLRAREKLLQDLHDKLGHMLVTASIGAQATAVLLNQDVAAAKERLASVTQQLQAAMQSLRDVLAGKTITYSPNDLLFEQFLTLARETEKQTGYSIAIQGVSSAVYDALPLSHRSLLHNALMEGLTNGIRHGKATAFICNLTISNGLFHMNLQDNGSGFSALTYGYGLSKIKRDVERLGGHVSLDGIKGCTLCISLPLAKLEKEGVINADY